MTLAAAVFIAYNAAARTFPIPAEQPIATIEIPDDWRPNPVRDGVNGSATDGAVRLLAQFIRTSDLDAAGSAALAALKQEGVTIIEDTRRELHQKYNKFDALKIDYSGTDSRGESAITMILVTISRGSGVIAICYWGDDDAEEAVSNDLISIIESLRSK